MISDILSTQLKDALSKIVDRNAVRGFLKKLNQFEIDFEKTHDGSIATSGKFVSCLQSHHVIENIVGYVLCPNMGNTTEENFLKNVEDKIGAALKYDTGSNLSPKDQMVVREFLREILNATKTFSAAQISPEERNMFYILYQNNAELKEVKKAVEEGEEILHQKLDSIIQRLPEQKNSGGKRMKAELSPEYDELIRSYNDTLRNARNRIEVYSMNRLDFDTVYVQPTLSLPDRAQPLVVSANDGISFSHQEIDLFQLNCWRWKYFLPEPDSSKETLYIPLSGIFETDNIIYVIGGAGYGKSLFLRNLEVNPNCLSGFQKRPLLILSGDIKRLMRPDGTLKAMQEFLEECFSNHSLATPDEFAPDFLQRCLDAGRCLILLDALDEVGNDQRDTIHNLIIDYFKQYAPDNKICITSRDRGFIPREQITCFCIEPITVKDVNCYVDKFIALNRFDQEEKERFVEQAADLVVKGFVKGFLTLSLLMAIYKNDQELPANKVLLYEKCFEYMANSREKGKKLLRNSETNEPYDWKMLGQFMQDATFMGVAQLGRPNNADIPEGQIRTFLTEQFQHRFFNCGECQSAIDQFLQFCSDRTEILIPSNGRNGYYRFYHRSFFEFFIARHIETYTHSVIDTYAELTRFNADSEVFELLVVLYMQHNPGYLRELLDYIFKLAESSSKESDSPIQLDILVLLMQAVSDIDFIQRFIVLFTKPDHHLSQKRLDVSYNQICAILNRNPSFLQEQLEVNLKQLQRNVEYELIGFLSNSKSLCKDILSAIKKGKKISQFEHSDGKFTYSKLLAELPESNRLLEECLTRLNSPKYLYGHMRLRNEKAKCVLGYASKILSLSVRQRALVYHLFVHSE